MKEWNINPKTNRTKHGQRRHQILAVAGQLVAAEGLEGLKMPIVAKEIGISTPALYRHFPSKEALVAVLAGRVVDDIHVVLSEVRDAPSAHPCDVLARFSGAYIELSIDDPVTSALLNAFVTDPRRLVVGPMSDEIWGMCESWWESIESSLRECRVSEGRAELGAWGLWTALQGQLGALKFAERRGGISVRDSAALASFSVVMGIVDSSFRLGLAEWTRSFKQGASRCAAARGGTQKWWEL